VARPVYVHDREAGRLASADADERAGVPAPQHAQRGRIRCGMFVATGAGYRRRLLLTARKARQPSRDCGLKRCHWPATSIEPGGASKTSETTLSVVGQAADLFPGRLLPKFVAVG
jgi:hypothetical protein